MCFDSFPDEEYALTVRFSLKTCPEESVTYAQNIQFLKTCPEESVTYSQNIQFLMSCPEESVTYAQNIQFL